MFRKIALALGSAAILGLIHSEGARAQDGSLEERLKQLESLYTELLIRDAEKEKVIEGLRQELDNLQKGKRTPPGPTERAGHDHAGETAEEHAAHGHGPAEHGKGVDLFAVDVGDGTARLSGVFVDTSFAAGGASETGETLEQLQFGDHDPDTNGFTLRTVDLSVGGGFDPYFDAFANVAFFIDNEGETVVELEEAYLQTQTEPGVIPEIRAGQFFTEFGLANPVHIHDQTWLDQPFVLSRFLGPDGMRGQGARLEWRTSKTDPLTLLGGVQNSFGETQASFRSSDELFEELPIGGIEFVERDVDGAEDLTYHARASKQFSWASNALSFGASGLFGPNASGPDGDTIIAGFDTAFRHELADGSHLLFQGEFLYRDYEVDDTNPSGAEDFDDHGLYAQVAYGMTNGVTLGLRGEYGSGDGESVGEFAGRAGDPFRSDRIRISPLLAWAFTPFSTLTLQYNYDDADFLADDTAHAVWLGLNLSIGGGRRLELNPSLAHTH